MKCCDKTLNNVSYFKIPKTMKAAYAILSVLEIHFMFVCMYAHNRACFVIEAFQISFNNYLHTYKANETKV